MQAECLVAHAEAKQSKLSAQSTCKSKAKATQSQQRFGIDQLLPRLIEHGSSSIDKGQDAARYAHQLSLHGSFAERHGTTPAQWLFLVIGSNAKGHGRPRRPNVLPSTSNGPHPRKVKPFGCTQSLASASPQLAPLRAATGGSQSKYSRDHPAFGRVQAQHATNRRGLARRRSKLRMASTELLREVGLQVPRIGQLWGDFDRIWDELYKMCWPASTVVIGTMDIEQHASPLPQAPACARGTNASRRWAGSGR